MLDWYAKLMLTIIAGALIVLAFRELPTPASANSSCGTLQNPCYIQTMSTRPLHIMAR